MSYSSFILPSTSLFLALFFVCVSVGFTTEDISVFDTQVQTVGEFIQQDNLMQAQEAVDQFWSEHNADAGFVDAVRRIKDYYWAEGNYDQHFVLCERIVEAFPNDPLSIGIQVDQVTGYIKLKDKTKAAEKLEQFWTRYSSDDRFVDFARWIKDQYWMDGYHKEHFDLCERLVQAFPNNPLAMNIWADDVTGYVRVGNMSEAAEKLEQFWEQYSSKDDFVQHVRYVKDVCWLEGEYDAHFDLCERIVKTFPDDPLTIRIGADEITGYIRLDEMDTARQKLEQFWEKFGSKEEFVQQVRYIKDVCWLEGEYDLHFKLCDRIAKAFPEDPLTIGIRTDEITGYIKREKLFQADEKLGQFLADYNSGQRLVEYLNAIAIQYSQIGNYKKADELYQYALENSSPDDDNLILTHMGRIISQITTKEDLNEIRTQINLLSSEYADNPRLAESLFMAGEQFYLRGENALKSKDLAQANADFQEAIEIWENSINQTEGSRHQCLAYYYSAVTYQKLNDLENAIHCYQQVVNNWPDYEKAWYAQYMIAKYYEKLAVENKTSIDDARSAYQLILERYPQSSAAQIAIKKVNTL